MRNSNLTELYKTYEVQEISDDEFIGDIFLKIMDDYIDEQLNKDLIIINGRLYYVNIDFGENFDNIKLITKKITNEVMNKFNGDLFTITENYETINNILYIKRTKKQTFILTYTMKQKLIETETVMTTINNINSKLYNI